MNRFLAAFLQTVIVLIGIATLVFLIVFPLTEGRAQNLGLLSIYLDPFILYGYMSSVAFFIALYEAFKLLSYLSKNEAFSLKSVKALKRIKHCAIALSILIVTAGLFILILHDKEDDPAGFLALCFIATVISLVVVAGSTRFEKVLRRDKTSR